ncbi:DUF3078 domain-containing protein [Prolixibacteraceae bacterium Z1-6]|uniref:DUF3078 domain-containing protein n=1 Tax=Draconibacterium aestuarii TaxID=2998507 RepID=A0A9X3F865_9BACT|nr:DUF3078 domain-containing protein [Prolixibacteraceae bacterium Z1-6]
MFSVNKNSILFTLVILSFSNFLFAQNNNDEQENEVLENSIQMLKNYFYDDSNWHVVEPNVGNNVTGLINYLEDQPIDDIIKQLQNAKLMQGNYVLRLPENVEDSLSVPGYISAAMVKQNIGKIEVDYKNEVKLHEIMVPTSLIEKAQEEVETVPPGKGIALFTDSVYTFPENLIIPEVIPDSVLNSPEQFNQLVRIDSIRNVLIETKRLEYNDSITAAHVNSVVREYRQKRYNEGLEFRINRYKDSVKSKNYLTLKTYNDQVITAVNDSIKNVIEVLSDYADFIDTTRISLVNYAGESEDILLQNGNERYSRIWLKNEQNDSLRVMVKNIDKRSVQMLIDDGVTFSRFKQKETKDFDFESLKGNYGKFNKVGKSYELETPWNIGGEGSAGFSQTYLNNWQKGGQSALSTLVVLKGFANYSRKDNKVKWENSAEIRSGWIRPGGDEEELQKNDDKFELTSRVGVSAFKKWYYSSELNTNTQFFRGYKYPKADNPVPFSGFMAPLTTYFKIGLDYKPNKDFSAFVSPLSLKSVYVRDTSLINQIRYGVDSDRKAYWEPGLNVDMKYKMKLTNDITYETKYKMFMNYQDPFKKFDLNWENLFKMQVTDNIGMQFMLHFIYDDSVKFPVYNDDGDQIGSKAKLQTREFFSVGFTYKINKKVLRTHRVRQY